MDNNDLNGWIYRLSKSELPVLKHTVRDLVLLREDENKLTAHSIANAIRQDPVMTVKLLRYLQEHKRKAQITELVQVEQALLMLGTEQFFRNVMPELLIEDQLKAHVVALPPLLRLLHRSHRASEYAFDWAVYLKDLRFEEVRVAALLHDIAEILMWCFLPEAMLKIRDLQLHDKAMRSRDAQMQVLGFTLAELQKELVMQWGLPELLITLMNDASAGLQRVRNVIVAVNLARHSANGWNDAALPDDYRALSELLHIPLDQAMAMVMPDRPAGQP